MMGYNLSIGQLITTIEADGLDSYIRNDVEFQHNEGAPAFGDMGDGTNSRYPSYVIWADCMWFVGLYDFMFSKDNGLIRDHPGCVLLTQEHKQMIDKAYTKFYAKYPNAKAGYPKDGENAPEENSCAVRLEWLKYWVDWALVNCSKPVFVNS